MCIANLVHFAFIFFFIDADTGCINTVLNWTCLGGYLKVREAKWKTDKTGKCIDIPGVFENHDVIMHMKNNCDNETFCGFPINDSSFGISCENKCTGLFYVYECVSKSLVLLIFFIIFSTI